MVRFIEAQHAILSVGDVDLVDATWTLLDAPIGCQRQPEELQQQRTVYAVMADEHDRVVRMAREHEPHDVGGSGGEVLQRFAVRKRTRCGVTNHAAKSAGCSALACANVLNCQAP